MFVLGGLFLHKPVSDICDALLARIGREPYEVLSLLGIAGVSVAGAVLLRRSPIASAPRSAAPPAGGKGVARWPVAAAVLLLAAASLAAQRWLLVINVELIHFPQFGLLAALLLAAGLGPQAAWLGATVAGVVDEAYQHLVVYAGVPNTYFDYNDIVLDGLGAAWAVVLAGAGRGRAPRSARALGAAMFAAVAVALWLAPPRLAAREGFPFYGPVFVRAATGRDYHVMAASEGLAALVFLLWVVALAAGRDDQGSRR